MNRPFNDLPLLPPGADIETKAILRKCIAANTALAELKATGALIPNQTILVNALGLQESKASSEIENIVTTQDSLYQAALNPQNADANAREVLRYREALYQGCELSKTRPLSVNTFVQMCRTLRGISIDVRRTPGTALKNPATGEVVYTPPRVSR